ncbi:MAG: flagellar basal body-associated FliL family protein [Desulfobulbaceae bacterium]|nr:flagellar basal body-associated FliL family protein [Desulfobulbaceae bacterium]
MMVGVGVGGYFLGNKHGAGKAGEGAPAVKEGAESAGEAGGEAGGEAASEAGGEGGGEGGGKEGAAVGTLVAFDDILVNLLDDQEPRYLKAAITLELSGPAAVAEANARKAQIRDAIILLLSNKTLLELRDMQGKLQLRADLMEKINAILRKGKVKTLYFTDFIVQ